MKSTAVPDLPLSSRAVRWLLGAYAYALGSQLANIPLWLTFFCGALLIWRHVLQRRQKPLPGTWIRGGLAIVLFVAVAVHFRTIWGRDAGMALMIGLISIKFLELRSRRDFFLIVFVSYFLVLGALLFSQAMPVCLYLITVVIVLTAALLKVHEGASPETVQSPGKEIKRLLGQSGRLVLQALPFTVVLFLFFPRIQGQLGFQSNLARQGLTDTLQAGSYSRLSENDDIAFRVDFPNNDAPPTAELYWRAFVLWQTDGEKWTRGAPIRARSEHILASRSGAGREIEQHFVLRPHRKTWLFALDHPVATTTPVDWRQGMSMDLRRPLNTTLRYHVVSHVGAPIQEMDGTGFIRRRGLQLPATLDPRIRALAEGWRRKNPQDQAILQEAIGFFQKGGFTYETNPGAYGIHGTAEFLFERRTGFCEHFASAFAILMRTAGVPARIVAGYFGGEYNSVGNFYVVRQSSAHAWCEVWLEGVGWQRVDPVALLTPERATSPVSDIREEQQPDIRIGGYKLYRSAWEPVWLKEGRKSMRQHWDWLNEQWEDRVLDYDDSVQWQMMQQIGMERWGRAGPLVSLMLGVGGLIAVLYRVISRPSRRLSPEQQAYLRCCHRLSKRGVVKKPWEGPVAFTVRAAESFPEEHDRLIAIGRTYAEIRYGPAGERNRVETLDQLVHELQLRS